MEEFISDQKIRFIMAIEDEHGEARIVQTHTSHLPKVGDTLLTHENNGTLSFLVMNVTHVLAFDDKAPWIPIVEVRKTRVYDVLNKVWDTHFKRGEVG